MTPRIRSLAGFVALLLISTTAPAQNIPAPENLWRLETIEDTDNDRRITIHDHIVPFELRDRNGAALLDVTNVYPLSVLLQELKRATDRRQSLVSLDQLHLHENPVARTHRLIKQYYWDALTRRIDADHLDAVVPDSKVQSASDYIYVPRSDPVAVRYFQALEQAAARQHRSPPLKVVLMPEPQKISANFVRRIDGYHGILSLQLETNSQGQVVRGVPYAVPGGRFNELYYWDSYFTVLGLLKDGRADLARGMAENLVYAMRHYGKIPNANRTYYLTRSQPPFLTSILRAVYESGAADRAWLARGLDAALDEYQTVWLGQDRLVTIGPHKLSRYFDTGYGPAPEVEAGHYDEKLLPWIERERSGDHQNAAITPLQFLNEWLYCGKHADLKDGRDLTLAEFFKHDRAMRECGHDTTHRFDDRAADFVSVDLNSLLYKYETDFAELLEAEFGGRLESLGEPFNTSAFWTNRARARKQAMLDLMWDESKGYFFDYDFVHDQRSGYISATGLYPLWARLFDARDPADLDRARRTAAFALAKLEQPAGLAASAKESVQAANRRDPRQWDYPYGWPPHQMLAWQGLANYGLAADAERLAYGWLYTIARNARDYNGVIPEKYNVVTGSHEVFVEYGNVGTRFDYIAPEGFGWMNASFQVGPDYLSARRLADLEAFKRPP